MDPHNLMGAEIASLINLIKRQTMAPCEGMGNITRNQGLIIAYLIDHPDGVLQKEIEEQFTIRRSTVSRVLKLMEQNQLVTRRYTEEDARLKKIYLTEKAGHLYQQVLERLDGVEQRMVRDISPEELETFRRVLCKIRDNLNG